MASKAATSKSDSVVNFARQAERLSLTSEDVLERGPLPTTAVEARFITPRDPVIETAGGHRLPLVPVHEALTLNQLKEDADGREHGNGKPSSDSFKTDPNSPEFASSPQSDQPNASFRSSVPSSSTHPLFPQLPLYGPPSFLRSLQSIGLRCTSSVLSLAFLTTLILGSAFTCIPQMVWHVSLRLTFRDPNARRPFYEEERKRRKDREEEAKAWQNRRRKRSQVNGTEEGPGEGYEPTEGGKDPLICDIGYYARRVGLDVEEFQVQTEDGFVLDLWHVYDPKEHIPSSAAQRADRGPDVFSKDSDEESLPTSVAEGRKRYPVLLIHGLLQSAGAYCCNDDDSLAFLLCKSGFDIWLGSNRCGFKPRHKILKPSDPRMWNWNIRQMGVMDLPALVSRVLSETGFRKLGLICHSQGTTETFVALAKGQRPELGEKISVFCALAPAVYAGPLIGKMYFKFMRLISPGMFRLMFGIGPFIPFMMTMHSVLPGKIYGFLGYRVFSFLFSWTDERWDKGLRDRLFQFAPVYVSAESMRWWLGRECFATQKCILATREEGRQEDEEDKEEDCYDDNAKQASEQLVPETNGDRGSRAWYNDQAPPFALWIPGSDQLVDGRRLLRRFERGREPHIRLVHTRLIEEYEHLDVLWAIDAVDKVAKEVREVLWKTAPPTARDACRVPTECETVEPIS